MAGIRAWKWNDILLHNPKGNGGRLIKKERGKPIEVLLVEDNPGDIRLTQEAFKEGKVRNNLHIATDGVEAMDFLKKVGDKSESPRPDLILLDLNLPRKDGREVLAEIKNDEDLKTIPVVILTTSRADEDILKTYRLHANCYITKPVDLEQFLNVVQTIENFWLTMVKLP
jgi:chemotaxis family two-component system response regulator Rcp1